MNAEMKYYELYEEVDRTWDEYCRKPCFEAEVRHREAVEEFQDFCVKILERLMEENVDVLKNLKEW